MASRKDSRGRVLNKGEIQRKDGAYAYVYLDSLHKRRTVYAKTLADLRKKESEIQKSLSDGINYGDAVKTTVNDIFNRYIATKAHLKVTTTACYNQVYDNYVRDTFGKRIAASIKYSDVLMFYQELASSKGLRSATIKTVDCVLNPAFQMAVRDNFIRVNPCAGAMSEIRKMLGKDCSVRKPLTEMQQKAFLDYCRNSKTFKRWGPLFTVLLGTGCRIGEILGLRWCDIDFENKTININHTLSYRSISKDGVSRCVYKVTTPKTSAGNRIIPMIPSVHDALIIEKEKCDRTGYCKIVIDGMSDFVFFSSKGGVYNASAINVVIERIIRSYNATEERRAKELGNKPESLPAFSCHVLRHTFCSRFCESETNIKTIQSVMGHASISTTMDVYAKVSGSAIENSLNSLYEKKDIF